MPSLGTISFDAVHGYGALVAVPGAASFVEVASYQLGRGHVFVGALLQGLKLTPSTTHLERIVPGMTWRAYLRNADGSQKRPIILRRNGQDVPWTFTDGTPAVRNLVVPAESPLEWLSWGVEVTDVNTLPAELAGFYGAIVGLDVPEAAVQRPELLQLLKLP